MSGDLTALKRVAALDAKIFALLKQSQSIPEQIKQEQSKLDASRQQLAGKEAEFRDARVKADLKDKDFQIAEQVVIKLREQIGQAKSNKEFQALQHEILSKEADNGRLEDAALLEMQKADRRSEERSALAKEIKEAEATVKADAARLEQEHEKVAGEIAKLRAKRSAESKGVPEDIFAKYERLIQRRGQTAMVAAVNGSCQGCFMQLRPETIAQLRKGNDLVFCHSCARILYLEE
jgi:predicted  nucleic acid-binding Zn-ribbon protein